MENKNNHLKVKWVIMIIFIIIFAPIIYTRFQQNITIKKAITAKKTVDSLKNSIDSVGVRLIDSVVKNTVDSTLIEKAVQKAVEDDRFKIYDAIFMYRHMVVVDENDSIIGTLILYTNNKEVDSFYSQSGVVKTPLSTRIKMKLIKSKNK